MPVAKSKSILESGGIMVGILASIVAIGIATGGLASNAGRNEERISSLERSRLTATEDHDKITTMANQIDFIFKALGGPDAETKRRR